MTASLASAEKGKAACVGRCFSSATFPQRQPRRVSISPAGVVSSPRTHSTGLALKIGSREASPIHPGLVSLPGSQSVLLHLTKRDQLGGDLLREGAQRRPVIGLLHLQKMKEASHEDVASLYVNPRG